MQRVVCAGKLRKMMMRRSGCCIATDTIDWVDPIVRAVHEEESIDGLPRTGRLTGRRGAHGREEEHGKWWRGRLARV